MQTYRQYTSYVTDITRHTHADLSVVHISSPKGSHFTVVLSVVVKGVRSLSSQPYLRQHVTRAEHRVLTSYM